MPHKLNNWEVDKCLENRLIKRIGKYIDSKTKIKWKCLVDGHEWESTPEKIIGKRQQGCPKCGHHIAFSDTEFDNKLKEVNTKIKRVGNYINSRTKIQFECLVDGFRWMARPNDILSKSGCPKCCHHVPINNKYIDEKIKQYSLPILRLEDVLTSRKKIKWKCLIDGYEWSDKPNNIINNCVRREIDKRFKYFGCKECRKRERVIKFNTIIDIEIKDRNIKRLDEYKSSTKKIKFWCFQCNKQFFSSYANIVYSGSGCPFCRRKGEKFVYHILTKLFSKQYQIKRNFVIKVKSNKRHRFIIDFRLKSDNIIFVEFNGSQHYKPTKFCNISDDLANKNFRKQVERDTDLRKYCLNNNITLIEIPYWIVHGFYDEKKLTNYLIKKFNKLD